MPTAAIMNFRVSVMLCVCAVQRWDTLRLAMLLCWILVYSKINFSTGPTLIAWCFGGSAFQNSFSRRIQLDPGRSRTTKVHVNAKPKQSLRKLRPLHIKHVTLRT
uniref:Putative secreted protein n=1 Tax=Anopheles marajoara TaxID=58244 RepID=A0A2M4C8K6_9DIPT